MNARTPIVLLLSGSALALGACGSSSKSDTLSKTDIAAKASAICKASASAASKITAPADFGQPTSDPVAAATYLAKIEPITKKEAADLAALKPADDVKADYTAFVAKENELLKFLDGLLAKAKAKDKTGLQDLQQVPQLGQEFTAAASKVGATDCAKS